jgi:hypothetical protein
VLAEILGGLRFAFGCRVSFVVSLLRFLLVVVAFLLIVRAGRVEFVVFGAGFAFVLGAGRGSGFRFAVLVVLSVMHVEPGEFGVIFGLRVALGKRLGLRRIERVLCGLFALRLSLFMLGFSELLGERSHFVGREIGFVRSVRLK